MRIGTAYFPSVLLAAKYYQIQEGLPLSELGTLVRQKIEAGEIFIGKPKLKKGETLLLIDNGCRYAVEYNDKE